MDLGLDGKRALVLASSQGLGLGVASKLCAEGAHVLISGRSVDKLQSAAETLSARGPGKAHYAVSDLAEEGAARELYHAAEGSLGGVDILVNNSGGPPPGPTGAAERDAWHRHFDAMVVRIIEITGMCLPAMKKQGWGRVLSIASSGVVQPIPNLAASNTIRAALVGWNKTLSNEVGGDGITANILAPGRIHTSRVDQIDAGAAQKQGISVDEVRAASMSTIPAGRYGTVEEFAAVAAFLVSEPASYVTGSVIRCDGGYIKSV
jgi:3-oxoacyl-[acyl-carrier protein] reductase